MRTKVFLTTNIFCLEKMNYPVIGAHNFFYYQMAMNLSRIPNDLFRSRDNTPAPLLNMDKEHEEQMINNFRAEMEEKIKEKEREQAEEKQEREMEKKEEEVEQETVEEAEVATEIVASEETAQTEPAPPKDESIKVSF